MGLAFVTAVLSMTVWRSKGEEEKQQEKMEKLNQAMESHSDRIRRKRRESSNRRDTRLD